MALAVGDIIQYTLIGNFNSAVALRNVFHQRVTELGASDGGGTFNAIRLGARKLWENYGTDIRTITASLVRYTSIRARVIRGADDGVANLYLIDTSAQAGIYEGQSLPPANCWTFRYQGAGGIERNGYKRFAGVPEAMQSNGFADGVGGTLDALAATLAEEQLVQTTDIIPVEVFKSAPVIVKKIASGLDPEDLDVLADWEPVGIVYNGIGTQNSRKYGVGI